MASEAVRVDGLVVRFGSVTAVDGLDLVAHRGEVTAIIGPNGAGKTTTVRCCEGLTAPTGGRVSVLGRDPRTAGAWLRPRVGVVLQGGGGVYPGAHALEMLRHVATLHAHPLDVDSLAERLDLHASGRRAWRRLSGGERQRLAVAMAVVGRPELVFLDEPTTGLDPRSRRATWSLIEDLRHDGVAVVLTTHHMDEAEHLADSVVVMDAGRAVAHGRPAELTGGGASDVSFRAPTGLPLGELVAALPPSVEVSERPPGRYRVRGEVDAAVLATLTAWCASRKVAPLELATGRRTLEDVFLELTGKDLGR